MKIAATDLDREDIKAAIRKTGASLKALSHSTGYCSSAVAITLRRPWPAVEAVIATHLGRKPQDIWPSRYDADGVPLRGVRSNERDISRTRRPAHRPKKANA